MDLTPENKTHIDSLSYEELLRGWRFAPPGDSWFQDETGKYWGERMERLRQQDDASGVTFYLGRELDGLKRDIKRDTERRLSVPRGQ